MATAIPFSIEGDCLSVTQGLKKRSKSVQHGFKQPRMRSLHAFAAASDTLTDLAVVQRLRGAIVVVDQAGCAPRAVVARFLHLTEAVQLQKEDNLNNLFASNLW